MFLGFFAVIIVIIIMVTLFGLSKKNTLLQPNSTGSQNVPSPTVVRSGNVKVVLDPSSSATLGGRIFLNITADSDVKDITGFDILLSYDPTLVEITQVQSVNPDFQIIKKDAGQYLTITGFKNPSASAKHVFQDSPIISIVAKPKSKGSAVFEILGAKGREMSKFIDTSSQTFYPVVSKNTVEIK